MELNKNQALAVQMRGTNILVSAGAGAGKTAVLVQRILGLLRETEIDAFLVLTFTKDAAAEMKRRIERSLLERSTDPTLSREERMHLKKQSSKVDDAHIQTFHAFCSDVLKEYFQEAGVDPNFVVLTETERKLMLDEAYETAVSNCLNRGMSPHLFTKYEVRIGSTESVKSMVLQMLDYAESEHSFEEALNRGLKFMVDGADAASTPGVDIANEEMPYSAEEELKALVEEICRIRIARVERRDLPHYERLFSEVCGLPTELEELFRINYENLGTLVDAAKRYELHPYKNERVKNSALADATGDGYLWGATWYRDIKKLKEDANALSNGISKELQEIVSYKRHVDACLLEREQTKAQPDFSPGMEGRYAEVVEELRMLAELTLETRHLFAQAKNRRNALDFSDQEHFALELLETNPQVREELRGRFAYIFVDENQDSSGIQEHILHAIRREDNLFKVGDLKQSIYGFRNADPKIFRDALEQAKHRGDEVIKLEENYRTRKEVLDFVNRVFAEQMPELYAFGSLEAAGGHVPLADGNLAVEYHTYPRKPHFLSKEPVQPAPYDIQEEDSNATRAAKTLAHKVMELMNSRVADGRDEEGNLVYRSCRYSDIVILLRNRSGAIADIPDVFRGYGIPVEVQGGRGFFDRGEIVSTLAMLHAVVNPYSDVEFVGALLSPYFSFSAEEVMRIATFRDAKNLLYFYDACREMLPCEGEKTSNNDPLAEKIRNALATLDLLRMRSKYMAFDELIWQVYQVGGFYDRISDAQRTFHLRYFASKLGDPRRLSLSEFLETIDISAEVQSEFTGMDVVRVMTVHKSKGMEFTNVILADIDKRFSTKSTSGSLLLSRRAGFSIQKTLGAAPKTKQDDFLRTLVTQHLLSEQYDEELRVLYVAMTRAKERLILLGADKNSENSYGQIIQNYIVPTEIRIAGTATLHAEEAKDHKKMRVLPLPQVENTLISVEKVVEARVPDFLAPVNIGIDRGREVHFLLETFDFKRLLEASKEDMPGLGQSESGERGIGKDENCKRTPIAWTGNLMADQFLNSEFALRIANADEIYREEDYVFFGEEGKTQGIIDLFFVEDGEIVLVDYKTDYYGDEQRLDELVERYSPQLKRYKDVLEYQYGKKVKESYICFLSGSGIQRRMDAL